ncbi:unnamed protein product, partial [Adineta ricciae]
ILNDASIVGKLRWEGIATDTNEARHYGRFFLCPSDIQQIRLAHRTSSTIGALLPKTTPLPSTTPSRLPSSVGESDDDDDDKKSISKDYKILLRWILHNQTYICPPICSISLYSLIYVSFDDVASLSSSFFIDSCDFIALYPYSEYLQTRRLISGSCSADPTVIHLSSETNSLSTFHYSFYLYNILREPIPFEIQCKVSSRQELFVNKHVRCSTTMNNDQLAIVTSDTSDYSYVSFRSSPIDVLTNLPSNLTERKKTPTSVPASSSFILVQRIQYFLFSFSLLFSHRGTF